jgi:8-oxo-dGTP pyrophosphatase MutT (NUDIX family)
MKQMKVCAVIRDSRGRFILRREGGNEGPKSGNWGFFKGRIREGEGAEEALLRLMLEDYGISIRNMEFSSLGSAQIGMYVFSAKLNEDLSNIRNYEGIRAFSRAGIMKIKLDPQSSGIFLKL